MQTTNVNGAVMLVRHGQTDQNVAGVYQGASDLAALTEHGKSQVYSIVDYIGSRDIDRIFCSPLSRARETLEIFRQNSHFNSIPAQITKDLIETSIPEWLGRDKREIALSEQARLRKWREVPEEFETISGVSPLSMTIERIDSLRQSLSETGGVRLIVAHDHVNRCLITSLMGLPYSLHSSLPQKNASLTFLKVREENSFYELQASNLSHFAFSSLAAESRRPRIILVRHGTTPCNRDKIYQGSRINMALDEQGRGQVDRLSLSLKRLEIGTVISSSLQRARETAAGIRTSTKVPYHIDERLNEFEYGHWTGLSAREVQQNFPGELRDWQSLKVALPIAGAESLNDFSERVRDASSFAWKEAKDKGTVLLVAHDVVIRTIISQALGLEIDHSWKFPIANGAVSEISMAPSGAVSLNFHNVLPGRLGDRHDDDYL